MAGPFANHVTRSNIWSTELKEVLQDEIEGLNHVKWLDQFTDGDTFSNLDA